ncbi:MAG: nuclear transport factor 2 family protein [Hydrogenophilaceae bacterium]|nr:nuclear transport factor 2 family protein [Hydrogenophilaceae bacterium]
MARLLAEAEIARLVLRYAALNDAGDYEALAALFTADGVFIRPSGGEPVVGRAAILASYKARAPRISRHLVSNILADVSSSESARCTSAILLYSAAPGAQAAASPALLGGFADKLVRVNGAWLFAERRGWIDLKIGS